MSLDWLVLQSLVDASPFGVVVCDARAIGWPVVYLNHAFELLCGYQKQEIIGRNLTLLQQADNQQEGLQQIRQALKKGVPTRAVLRNYRKDGSKFINEIQIVPIRDQFGQISHFASFHRQGSASNAIHNADTVVDSVLSAQSLTALREDRQTGLLSRAYFDDQLRRDFAYAQREHRPITVFVFSIDSATAYKEVFGASGAELTFKRVAGAIAGCFRRASDLSTRWDEFRIITGTLTTRPEDAYKFAQVVQGRVRDLAIHHPRAAGFRHVTISVGIASHVPEKNETIDSFIGVAIRELNICGANQVMQAVG